MMVAGPSSPWGSRRSPPRPCGGGDSPVPAGVTPGAGCMAGGGGADDLGGCRRKPPRAPCAICSSVRLNRAPHLCCRRGERIPHPKIAACRPLPSCPWKMLINTPGGAQPGTPPPHHQEGPQRSLLWRGAVVAGGWDAAPLIPLGIYSGWDGIRTPPPAVTPWERGCAH